MDATVSPPDEESNETKTVKVLGNSHGKGCNRPFLYQRYGRRDGQGMSEINLGGVVEELSAASNESAGHSSRGHHYDPVPASDVVKTVDKQEITHPGLNLINGESGEAQC